MVAVKIIDAKTITKLVLYTPNDTLSDILGKNFDIDMARSEKAFAGSKSCDFKIAEMTEIKFNLSISRMKSIIDR